MTAEPWLLKMTERVLNPASLGITTPLYQEEVRRAMEVIQQLVHVLEAQR